jgi:TorA maturation chaperone TorD
MGETNAKQAAIEGRETNVASEDHLRAQHYGLLARFLAAAPDADLLARVGQVGGAPADGTPLGQAFSTLARRAAATTPAAARAEYEKLFIGLGRGELLPYGSYYRTGFLNEKPLALLRQDMAKLGIARAAEVKEPEDHIAALAEMMAGLITGAFGTRATLAEQKHFFDLHLAPWGGRFFADLEAATAAALYQPIGTLGRVFMEIETTAFDMAA